MKKTLLALLALSLLISTASAGDVMEFDSTTQFHAVAPNDMTIYEIAATDIEPGANQTFNLNAYGQTYTLNVTSEKSMGWWTFYVSCTYPNGSTTTNELSSLQPFANDYDIWIQYFDPELDFVDADIYVGLRPLKTSFQFGEIFGKYDVIAFSEVSATSTHQMNGKVRLATEEEFQDVSDNNMWAALDNMWSRAFTWTWEQATTIIGKIPYIGPHLEAILTMVGMFVDETIFWFNLLIVENIEYVIMLVETWILADAIFHTKSFMALINRIIENHVKVISFTIDKTAAIVGMFARLVQAILSAIQTMKPV